jgi:hypothetical protein
MKRKNFLSIEPPLKKRKIMNTESIQDIIISQQKILNEINYKLNNINERLKIVENIIQQSIQPTLPPLNDRTNYFY